MPLLFPLRTASRHAALSGELHDVWHRQSLLYAHLPLNDALPGSRSFRVGRLPLVRQQQQQCCCYLIYNLPVLWRSGAAARWSRLHTPVETLTPPRRRGEIRSVPFPPTVCGLWAKTALRSFAPPLPAVNASLVSGGILWDAASLRSPLWSGGNLRGAGPLGVCRWTLFQYSIGSGKRVLRFCDIWSGGPFRSPLRSSYSAQVLTNLTRSWEGVSLARRR